MCEQCFQNIRCLVRTPKGFDPNKKYPVLLFLHGAGTRGDDISKLSGSAFYQITGAYEDFPFITVAPLCGENSWFDIFEKLKLFVKDILALPYADADRLYLMGTSMGGYGTWQLAMSMPECFAAIVPICGGGMYWNAGRLINVPVWAFHGGKDETVYTEESIRMVDALNRAGGSAKLTVYPENGHDAWTNTYSNPEVFSWLLSHTKKNEKQYVDGYTDAKIYG